MRIITYHADGGMLPPDLLDQVLAGQEGGQSPRDFGIATEADLRREVDTAWAQARHHWASLQMSASRPGAAARNRSLTRDLWLVPLLEILGFELASQSQALHVQDATYAISHVGVHPAGIPVHLVGTETSLTRRQVGRMQRSPYATVQEYLNQSDHVWGLVSNGQELWILRETHRVARPAYIAWDLASMMDGGRYEDFRAFYRLCHASRFPLSPDLASKAWIERYWAMAQSQGSRIRDRLRDGVERALGTLGQGFLSHPPNHALRAAVRDQSLTGEAYYRELLLLIYRLLFLMVAEERQMLFPLDDAVGREVYDAAFSVDRLRALAERPGFRPAAGHGDLWRGLVETFELFQYTPGKATVGTFAPPPLNGELFSSTAMAHLTEAELDNRTLLEALRPLTRFEDGKDARRVNYAGLDVEELGSVYESLLEYVPVLDAQDHQVTFLLGGGSDRKSTGSYYTPQELVGALIESALDPVIEERLRGPDPEQSLLQLAICDPACGSGHFLLAAARRVARALAQVRTHEPGEPAPDEYRKALREVIEHSVYGVDKNPLAVDLCKVALWIEGHNAGRPLSFLDHHIKLGDSLVGLVNSDELPRTIPDGAYKPKTGDDPAVAKRLKALNRQEAAGHQKLDHFQEQLPEGQRIEQLAAAYAALAQMPSDDAASVQNKERRYRALREESTDWTQAMVAAHLATAPFFAHLTAEREAAVPSTRHLQSARRLHPVPDAVRTYAAQLAAAYPFFHWSLEFPDVFNRGGFDVILGNPPWERVKLQQEEWFASRLPAVAQAAHKAARARLIAELETTHPHIWKAFQRASHRAAALGIYARDSGRFPLSHVGDVNTYALFLELGRGLLNARGFLGMVVPTAIATDYTYRGFFRDLLRTGQLVSLYDLENRLKLFPAVDSREKFALLTLSRRRVERARFAFFLTRPDEMRDPERVFAFTPRDLERVNPNTATCPVFRTRTDADITAQIYRRVPVLVNQRTGANPWGIKFLAMFHMANDSHLFQDRPGDDTLPLYEAKMMHQYDHRWATYDGGRLRDLTEEERRDPNYRVRPQYWVHGREVAARVPDGWRHQWFLGFRGIANATNARTVITAVVPAAAVGNSLPLLISNGQPNLIAGLVGNLNSVVLDYVARQKVGGTNLSFFLLKQFPLLPPEAYEPTDLAFIVPRVLELTYTATELAPFARDLGYDGPPFRWDSSRRAELQADLDGYFAHLYGLTREELQYILDPSTVKGPEYPGETFRALKSQEMRAWGEFRTYRLVLDAYDRLTPAFVGRDIAARLARAEGGSA